MSKRNVVVIDLAKNYFPGRGVSRLCPEGQSRFFRFAERKKWL